MTASSRPHFTWQLCRRQIDLGERTQVMAILNLTPDSFSHDGLLEQGLAAAVAAACAALESGADILDLGAESTRPGAQPISADEEQARLLPALEAVLRERPDAVLSVDTYHAATAAAAVRSGAEIVNDVSGLQWDSEMAKTVAAAGCGLVLMQARGRPTEWGSMSPVGHDEVLTYTLTGLEKGLAGAKSEGVSASAIVLDPGFAFGKLGAENLTLLASLRSLQRLERPVLVGLSRKGFLGSVAGSVQPQALRDAAPALARRNATLAANVAAILAGAHIVRVHDVQATREVAAVADAILERGYV